MVGETHVLHLTTAMQLLDHGLGMSNACDDKHVVKTPQVDVGTLPVQGLQCTVFQVAEKDFLVVLQLQVVDDVVLVNGIEHRRAFCHYHQGCAVACGAKLAQVAIGQDAVLEIGVAVLGEQEVDVGFDAAMLEHIVEHNDIGGRGDMHLFVAMLLHTPLLHQPVHAFKAFLAHCHLYVGMFGSNHGRLVAQQVGSVGAVVNDIPFAIALVATAQHGYTVSVREQAQQILHMGRLATATGA